MIRSVTGTVDAVPIVFTQSAPDRWEIVVPPDLEDGVYLVEITAEDYAGNQTYMVAELYMSENVPTRWEILQQKYRVMLLADRHHERGENMQKEFFVGEEKYVDVNVESTDGSAFVITSATYKLYDWEKKEVESGQVTITGHKLSVLLESPDLTGKYVLEIFYTVPPETKGIRVMINVT